MTVRAEPMRYEWLDSPIGRLLVAGDDEGLRRVRFPSESPAAPPSGWRRDAAPIAEAMRQLEAYFAGELTVFDLALAPQGTAFQQAVWAALREIPFGATISYGELAEGLGKRSASRAVGAANGANPLPIVAPCHRVIGADGSLTGFGGGVEIKRFLLAHERRVAPAPGAQGELPF